MLETDNIARGEGEMKRWIPSISGLIIIGLSTYLRFHINESLWIIGIGIGICIFILGIPLPRSIWEKSLKSKPRN